MWVGSKSVSGHFTVHKVEQLNLKKRELAGVYKILRRNWSLSSPSALGHFTFQLLGLVYCWFSFLMGAMKTILAMNLSPGKKKKVFPPKHQSLFWLRGPTNKDAFSLDQLLMGSLHTAFHWEISSQEGQAVSFWFLLCIYCHDSFGGHGCWLIKVLSRQVLRSEQQLCLWLLEMQKILFIRIKPKFQVSKRKNTRQWETDTFCLTVTSLNSLVVFI